MPRMDGSASASSAGADVPADLELERSCAASGYKGVIVTANGKFQGRVNIGNGVYRYCEVADTPEQAALKRALALRTGVQNIDEPKPRVQRGKGAPLLLQMRPLCSHCDTPSFLAGAIAKKRGTAGSPTSVLQLPDYGQPIVSSLLTVIATPLQPGEARPGMPVAFASVRTAILP